jgi:uncharacterized protein with HEPN domain
MSERDNRITLLQILEHAERARELCEGTTLPELLGDWRTRLAFVLWN